MAQGQKAYEFPHGGDQGLIRWYSGSIFLINDLKR